MRTNTGDIISRNTRTTARTVLLLSGALIAVSIFELRPLDWPLLQDELRPEVFSAISTTLILFLEAALLLSWSSDVVSYSKWFKSNLVSAGSVYGLGEPNPGVPVVEGLTMRLHQIERETVRLKQEADALERIDLGVNDINDANLTKVADQLKKSLENIAHLQKQLEMFDQFLNELPRNFRSVDRLAKFTVFFWYLALPVVSGIVALLFTLDFLTQFEVLIRNSVLGIR